jgi:hypothetical protein
MEVNGQLHALAALCPGKEPPAAIGYMTGWAVELRKFSISAYTVSQNMYTPLTNLNFNN